MYLYTYAIGGRLVGQRSACENIDFPYVFLTFWCEMLIFSVFFVTFWSPEGQHACTVTHFAMSRAKNTVFYCVLTPSHPKMLVLSLFLAIGIHPAIPRIPAKWWQQVRHRPSLPTRRGSGWREFTSKLPQKIAAAKAVDRELTGEI